MDSDDDVVYGPTPRTRGIVGFEKISPHIRRQTSADSSSTGALWASKGDSIESLPSVGRVHVSRRRRALGARVTTALGRGIDFGDVGSEQDGSAGHFQHNDLLLNSTSTGYSESVKQLHSHSFESDDSIEGGETKEDDDSEVKKRSARRIDLFPPQKATSTQNHTLAMELLQDRPAHWGVSTQPNGWRSQTQRQSHGQSGVGRKVKGKGKREGTQGTSAFAPGGLKRERKNERGRVLSSQQTGSSSVPLSAISFRPSFMSRPTTQPKEMLSEIPPAEDIASDVEGEEDSSSIWTAPATTADVCPPPVRGEKMQQHIGDKKRSGGIVADVLQCACAEEDSSVARLVSGLFPLRENTGKVSDLANPRSKMTWSVDLVVSQILPMPPNCLWIEGNVEGASMLGDNKAGGPGMKDCSTAASLVVGETVCAMFAKDTAQTVELIVAAKVRIYDPFVMRLEKHNKKVLLCTRKCEQNPPNRTIVTR